MMAGMTRMAITGPTIAIWAESRQSTVWRAVTHGDFCPGPHANKGEEMLKGMVKATVTIARDGFRNSQGAPSPSSSKVGSKAKSASPPTMLRSVYGG